MGRDEPASAPRPPEEGGETAENAGRRRELARFLRSRRERCQAVPGTVSGTVSGDAPVRRRRRTPGLRREEVAARCGISVTWYTWLEQGRDVRASRNVLGGLAEALGLDDGETAHLFQLAGVVPPRPVRAASGGRKAAAYREYLALLDQLAPNPAFITDRRLDILAWNRGFEFFYGDVGHLPAPERNLLWLTFVSPEVRSLSTDWELDASRLIGRFRARLGYGLGDADVAELVGRLEARSPDFRRLWDRRDVLPSTPVPRTLRHRALGVVEVESIELCAADGMTVLNADMARPGVLPARVLAQS